MAEPTTLPDPVFYSRVAGEADDAWEIVTNPVTMQPGVETEFVCVGPSAITSKTWDSTAEQELVRIREVYDTASGAFFVADDANMFEESNSTVPANDAGDVIGAWVDAVNDLVAIQATTANKPKLRFTPETGLRWADSNTATCALNVTFASALGSACTVARVGPDGVEFLEDQTIGTSYNIAPAYGYNSDIAIIDRPLTATEKALFTRFMLRHKPGLGPELITNGTFDTDVSGWASELGATLSWDAGRIKIVNPGTLNSRAIQLFTMNGQYYASASLSADVGVMMLRAGQRIAPFSTIASVVRTGSAPGNVIMSFSSPPQDVTFQLRPYSSIVGQVCLADNVSLKEII